MKTLLAFAILCCFGARIFVSETAQAQTHSPRLYSEFEVPRLADLEQQWKKRIWLAKTANKLWKGYELRESALLDRWMVMDEQAVVLEMLADNRFIRTAIDFSYYYLGRKTSDLPFKWDADESIYKIGQFPNVIQLAKQLEENEGNFFDFYSEKVPAYVFKLKDPPEWVDSIGAKPGETPPVLSNKQRRQKLQTNLINDYDILLGMLRKHPTEFKKEKFCNRISNNPPVLFWAQAYGYDFNTVLFHPKVSHFFTRINHFCVENQTIPQSELLVLIEDLRSFFLDLHQKTLEVYEADRYHPKTFSELKTGPHPLFENGEINPLRLSYDTYVNNNSTNFNRRRAAYYLDRFFCDDLTPCGH